MCWNADVSLKSWVFSLVGLAFGIWGGAVNWRILLIGVIFSFMQFVEYKLWTHLKDPDQNRFWSHIGQLTVWAEMFGAANVVENPAIRNFFFGASALHIFIADFLIGKKGNFQAYVGPNGHLVHNWFSSSRIYYLIPLLITLPFWFGKEILWAICITTTMLLSAIMYARSGEFSSMWCYISLAFWLIVIYKSIGLDKYCAWPKI